MRATLMFEPRDLWVGVFWDRRWLPLVNKDRQALVVYICLIPSIVLRLVFR
jgi:hypothetical protein